MLSRLLSLKAVFVGFSIVLILFGVNVLVANVLDVSFQRRAAVFFLVISVLPYVVGGYAAGILAGRNQVLNALTVGAATGLSLWLFLHVTLADAVDETGIITTDVVGAGAVLLAVAACGIGGLLSVLIPFDRRRVG